MTCKEKYIWKSDLQKVLYAFRKHNFQTQDDLSTSITIMDINCRFLKFWLFQGIICFMLLCFIYLSVYQYVCLFSYKFMSINYLLLYLLQKYFWDHSKQIFQSRAGQCRTFTRLEALGNNFLSSHEKNAYNLLIYFLKS